MCQNAQSEMLPTKTPAMSYVMRKGQIMSEKKEYRLIISKKLLQKLRNLAVDDMI